MRLLALAGMVCLASSSSLAQSGAPRPFQEKGSQPQTVKGLVTAQRIDSEIELRAKKRQEAQSRPLERMSRYYIFYPRDLAEFNALARYSVLLLTVISQQPEELPLKRVYIRTVDQEIPLLQVSSWRSNVDQRLLTRQIYRPHREDGFYLFPTSAVFHIGQVQADFAVNRVAKPVFELPIEHHFHDRVSRFQNLEPRPDALPHLGALQALIRRKTSGIPVPVSLPEAAAPSWQGAEPNKSNN
jgi:hypothetical protein